MDIPFDGIVSLLLFLVGIPAIVLQFMAEDVRRVLIKRVTAPREIASRLGIAVLTVILAILFVVRYPDREEFIWSVMFFLLLIIILWTTFQVQYRYGWREIIILGLKKDIIKKLDGRQGRLDNKGLDTLLEIGKQSQAGPDRQVILIALSEIAHETCFHPDYRGDALETLIDGLTNMLSTRPAAEDIPNYQIAVSVLTTILSTGGKMDMDGTASLIDQQHAVRAVSVIGQTFLSEINVSVSANHILMDYEEALGLAVYRHPAMLTDVSQSLLEVGAAALEHGHYLFAVATLERLLSILEESSNYSEEALADLLGLMAHFWAAGESSHEFAQSRLSRVKVCLKETLPRSIEKARLHSQMTMRFDTADKLSQMKKDLTRRK